MKRVQDLLRYECVHNCSSVQEAHETEDLKQTDLVNFRDDVQMRRVVVGSWLLERVKIFCCYRRLYGDAGFKACNVEEGLEPMAVRSNSLRRQLTSPYLVSMRFVICVKASLVPL